MRQGIWMFRSSRGRLPLLPRLWRETSKNDDLAPGVRAALDQLGLNIPTFSGFGQFGINILTLGKQTEDSGFQQRIGPASSAASGASARAVTTSTGTARFSTKSSIRRCTLAGAPVAWTASRKKAAFLPLLSTRCTSAPGFSASAQAMTTPGNPPPSRDRPMRALLVRAAEAAASRPRGASKWRLRLSARSNSSAAAKPAAWRQSDQDALLFHVKQGSIPARARDRLKALRRRLDSARRESCPPPPPAAVMPRRGWAFGLSGGDARPEASTPPA